LLVDGVRDYAIFGLDVAGLVATWNVAAQHLKGYADAEILGRHFSVFYPLEDLEARSVIHGSPRRGFIHRRWR
jgi:hypothetical protein